MWRVKGHKKRANNQKVSKLTLADVKQTLFDIPSCKFKIPRPDQNFYEDQKGPRVLKGKVSNANHANTSSASSPLVSKCGDTDPWNSWGWRWDGSYRRDRDGPRLCSSEQQQTPRIFTTLNPPVVMLFLNVVIGSVQFVAVSSKFYFVLSCAVRMKSLISVMLPSDLTREFFNVFYRLFEGWD